MGFEPTQSMTHLSMSMTITLHVWRLRRLGHCAMLWGLIFRILLESRFSQASHFRTLILQWGLDPGEWLIWHPHRGAHQHRLDSPMFRLPWNSFEQALFHHHSSILPLHILYFNHDEARTMCLFQFLTRSDGLPRPYSSIASPTCYSYQTISTALVMSEPSTRD